LHAALPVSLFDRIRRRLVVIITYGCRANPLPPCEDRATMTANVDCPDSTRRVVDERKSRGYDVEILNSSETTRSAVEAAAALGTSVAQIVKSLVFLVDGRPILALMSG